MLTMNRITDKANLFTDAGYLFASVNYRLSPDISSGSPDFDADRVRFPNHPDDVARAVAWIADHAEAYGGDPDSILLIGHSAGAHLVSLVGTNPEFMKRVGVAPNQVIGVVSLDTATFDISEDATPEGSIPGQRALLLWNAFGTPAEEASWRIIMDPIDGTRGLMYQKRSAWILNRLEQKPFLTWW